MIKKKDKELEKFHWHVMTGSEGFLALDLYFPNKNITKEEKEIAIASALAQSRDFMLSKGYLFPDTSFMSSSDLANEHGHTRQYWEKLLKEGKIPYKETAAGRITTDLWVQGYLKNKEQVDKHVRNRKKVISLIQKGGKKMGVVECPQCKEEKFDYAVNTNNINGICRANCGFRIHTTN